MKSDELCYDFSGQVLASKGVVPLEPWIVRKSEKYEGRYFFFNKETHSSVWMLNKKDIVLSESSSSSDSNNSNEKVVDLPSLCFAPRDKANNTDDISGGSGSSDASAASAGLIGGLVGGFMVLLIGLIYYRHRSHKQFGDGHSFDERDNGERDSADIESAYFRRGSGRSSSSYNNGHGNGNGNGQYDSRAMELMSMPSSETFNDDDIVQPSMMPPSPESNSSFRHQQSSNKTKKKPTPSSKNKKNNSTSPELKELQEFLCFGELDKFASSFLEFGITSVDDLCDMSLISDSELMSELGMQKMQVRKFRRLVTEKNDADEQDRARLGMITKSGKPSSATHVDSKVARESIGQNILSRRYGEEDDKTNTSNTTAMTSTTTTSTAPTSVEDMDLSSYDFSEPTNNKTKGVNLGSCYATPITTNSNSDHIDSIPAFSSSVPPSTSPRSPRQNLGEGGAYQNGTRSEML
mmetsp:Transcript_50528/g.64746  ORF Transcript_50528/g.64746 Transcript_50528/m.64746 type:complete len:464 (+) Transcript_50528:120-1511(+)